MKNEKSNMSVGKVLTIGTGALAVVAAGYFFLGPNRKENQKKTQEWMTKMKRDVVKKLESMKDVTKETYDTIVDTIGDTYTNVADSKDEVVKLGKELKGHWKSISSKMMQEKKKMVKKVSKK